MKKDFLENIKSLIEMDYYTDNESLRFLAWIKAKRIPIHNLFAGKVKN